MATGGRETVETANPARWRLIAGGAVLVALFAFVVAVWFAFQDERSVPEMASSDAVPIVRAPDGPDRVKPDDPGGVAVPDQDKTVYETFESRAGQPAERIERLLPPPEAPLPEPKAEPEPDPEQVAEPEPDAEAPKVIDVPTRPETVAPSPVAAPKAEPAPVAKPEPAPAPKPEPTPVARPAPEPEPKPAAKTAAKGEWQVQLAAFRDSPSAEEAWENARKKAGDLLKGMQHEVVRADLGDKGIYFRLRAGDFPSRDAANAFCIQVQAKGLGCLAARRSN
ncbi:MAG: SPOR domain-containing protein [Pseudomonadota bacterium]|nr:SPOR domain-containing protein [Pseudomonadota bacterium]